MWFYFTHRNLESLHLLRQVCFHPCLLFLFAVIIFFLSPVVLCIAAPASSLVYGGYSIVSAPGVLLEGHAIQFSFMFPDNQLTLCQVSWELWRGSAHRASPCFPPFTQVGCLGAHPQLITSPLESCSCTTSYSCKHLRRHLCLHCFFVLFLYREISHS